MPTPAADATMDSELVVEIVRLRAGTSAQWAQPDRVVLASGAKRLQFGSLRPEVRAAIGLLLHAGDAEAALLEGVPAGADAAREQLGLLLGRLDQRGWLERTLAASPDRNPLLTVRPVSHRAVPRSALPDPSTFLSLSRFALLRRGDEGLLLESPRAHFVAVLHDPRLATLAGLLCRPRAAGDLIEAASHQAGLPPAMTAAALSCLAASGFVVNRDGGDEEEDTQALAQWSLPDLLFHARSRQGRHANNYGATYPLQGRFEPLEVGKPAMSNGAAAGAIDLPRPDLARVATSDPSLTEVLEGRQSIRVHDDNHPIALPQLAELLFRAMGVRGDVTRFADGSERPFGCARPYPSGGALYELETYLAVRLCDGLAPGLYHYDALGHRLEPVAARGPGLDALLDDAGKKSATGRKPQVLVVLAARVGRLMYKYESMAYAAVLKNVGVVFQTVYAVGTAMELAVCALGGGDSDAFADVGGVPYLEEPSVGEIMLGSRPRGKEKPV